MLREPWTKRICGGGPPFLTNSTFASEALSTSLGVSAGIVTRSPATSGRSSRDLFAGSARSGSQLRKPASTANLQSESPSLAVAVFKSGIQQGSREMIVGLFGAPRFFVQLRKTDFART